MSKGLTSYPEEQRMAVARRRTAKEDGGCGYWGAVSFLNKHGVRTKNQSLGDAVNATVDRAMEGIRARAKQHKPRPDLKQLPRGAYLSPQNKRKLEALRG